MKNLVTNEEEGAFDASTILVDALEEPQWSGDIQCVVDACRLSHGNNIKYKNMEM
jgi:hypothetical protein